MHAIECLGVGSPLVDSLARVDESFLEFAGGAKGGMTLVDSARMGEILAAITAPLAEATGGSAGNTVVGMAHLGNRSGMLGKVGNDAAAEFFKASLERIGATSKRLKHGNMANGRCLSLITPDSERTMRTNLGAAATLAPEEISIKDFEGCRHVHVEGYLLFNRALIQKVLECAKAAGCTVSLDLASYTVVEATGDVLPQLLRDYCNVGFANEDEARALFGGNDFEKMARKLADLCGVGAVKLGPDGSLVCANDQVVHIEPIRVPQVADTTGAGDYWAAGFLHGWLQGKSLAECGRYGSILGAETVQVVGAALPPAAWERIRAQVPVAH